jgi:hypothetical protein
MGEGDTASGGQSVSISWAVKYVDPSGFEATLTISDVDSRTVMEKASGVLAYLQKIGAEPVGSTGQEPAPSAQVQPLAEGESRMLVTKIKRTDQTRADLYGRGHKYPDLKLFDLADLATVGIDPEGLPIGQEEPCRFFAVYTLSEKLNKAGNPYKDIQRLEKAE